MKYLPALLLVLLASILCAAEVPLLVIERHPIDSSHVYTYHTEGFKAGGGLFIYSAGAKEELKQLVASPQGEILDADVSFDRSEILFSWKKSADDSYHVYSIRADGTHLKQLTTGPHHNYNACWLPDGGIAFLSTRSGRFAYCWISPVGLLHRMDRDGGNVTRLSANIVNDFTPSVLNDGRIIYSRWEYVDKPAIPIQSLWTINPDGTGLAGYYGNRVLSPATFMNAHSIPNSTRVLCILTSHNRSARGAVAIIDRSKGDNAQAAITNLTPDVRVDPVNQGNGNNIRGPYETPFPLDEKSYLVTKDGAVVLREYESQSERIILKAKDGMGFYNAQPLRPRIVPPVIASKLEKNAEPWATVVLQDVYNGLEPIVKRGEVKEIAVVQEMEKGMKIDLNYRAFDFQFPVISCGATYAGKKVWGFAPVEEDGSASFKVPAGVPIYFLALDAQGRAVERMRTFTHLMPGEVQGCIGCHESRTQTTPPHRPVANVASPHTLREPDWGVRGFDYSTVVQPILDQHCGSCHAGTTPAAKVDLSPDKTDFFNISYETLARGRHGRGDVTFDNPYTNWIPTYNGHEANILQIAPKTWGSPRSKLADLLLSQHPDKAGKPLIHIDDASRRKIFLWIDLNIPYYGTTEVTNPKTKGARRVYPETLDAVLKQVAQQRCAKCHEKGNLPRQVWTRLEHPELNSFLLAPLAKSAGGTQACGKAVFQDTADADYRKILESFAPATVMLRDHPRDDMPGAKPAMDVCRDLK